MRLGLAMEFQMYFIASGSKVTRMYEQLHETATIKYSSPIVDAESIKFNAVLYCIHTHHKQKENYSIQSIQIRIPISNFGII